MARLWPVQSLHLQPSTGPPLWCHHSTSDTVWQPLWDQQLSWAAYLQGGVLPCHVCFDVCHVGLGLLQGSFSNFCTFPATSLQGTGLHSLQAAAQGSGGSGRVPVRPLTLKGGRAAAGGATGLPAMSHVLYIACTVPKCYYSSV